MCGIAGFLGHRSSGESIGEVLRAMTQTLAHRGPDDEGQWLDGDLGIGLGYRRLAIIDLSPTGTQPMASSDGRYTLVYNGEIYNFRELRRRLEAKGRRFRGTSDTEVLLEAISEWGLHEALAKSNGMFAFALWDKQQHVLHLARDRIGKKPLYYGLQGGTFLFGSELKALRAHPAFDAPIDRQAIGLYLRYAYVPSPFTIYDGIYKLLPGTVLTVHGRLDALPEPTPFWSLSEAVQRAVADPLDISEEECVETVSDLLTDATRIRSHADVPVGVFLSGGIDSSTVAALMQASAPNPVRSFTIGVPEREYDEAVAAQAVARHLGTEHTELYVTPQDALEVVPLLPELYDEPFADSSQIPTYLVSKLTRSYVKVGLSGDGGDEIFGGYTRYLWPVRLSHAVAAWPRPLRRGAAGLLSRPRPSFYQRAYSGLSAVLPRRARQVSAADKIYKFSDILRGEQREDVYVSLVSQWNGASLVKGLEGELPKHPYASIPADLNPVQKMMFHDAGNYLVDDILVKVDRASMGASLEMRAPLLDYRVVELAWRLPLRMKIRRGQGKWVLRRVLDRYVPRALVDRPKAGFSIPLDGWLRGPLREWAEELLAGDRLEQEGFFDPAPIRAAWDDHLSGRRNLQSRLWAILMFQSWLEHSRTKATA
ncbi:MAG: asparagine synthase (glutamine-hydrolyzing) [Actinomycetota bacterium]